MPRRDIMEEAEKRLDEELFEDAVAKEVLRLKARRWWHFIPRIQISLKRRD